MYIKTSIVMLFLLCIVLLTGCNVEYGPDSKAVQVTEDKNGTARERRDKAPEATNVAQLREDLRLANERARLAEEKAALEKQKREFAEERIRKSVEAGEEVDAEKPSGDEIRSGS